MQARNSVNVRPANPGVVFVASGAGLSKAVAGDERNACRVGPLHSSGPVCFVTTAITFGLTLSGVGNALGGDKKVAATCRRRRLECQEGGRPGAPAASLAQRRQRIRRFERLGRSPSRAAATKHQRDQLALDCFFWEQLGRWLLQFLVAQQAGQQGHTCGANKKVAFSGLAGHVPRARSRGGASAVGSSCARRRRAIREAAEDRRR